MNNKKLSRGEIMGIIVIFNLISEEKNYESNLKQFDLLLNSVNFP